jgi:hypothetical protein
MGKGNLRSSLGKPGGRAHHPVMSQKNQTVAQQPGAAPKAPAAPAKEPAKPKTGAKEIGGPAGPEPTRYGDWEIKGRCIDF